MGEGKHTPGPWYAEEGPLRQWFVRGPTRNVNGRPSRIACLGSPHTYESRVDLENEANARLIAASPEMFEALKQIAERHSDKSVDGQIARAAIYKATGGAL